MSYFWLFFICITILSTTFLYFVLLVFKFFICTFNPSYFYDKSDTFSFSLSAYLERTCIFLFFPLFHSINYQDFSLISYNFLPGPRFYSSILKFGRLLFISNFSARSKSCWQSPIFFIWILYYHSISVFQMTSPMS